jgi:hypothetical protein
MNEQQKINLVRALVERLMPEWKEAVLDPSRSSHMEACWWYKVPFIDFGDGIHHPDLFEPLEDRNDCAVLEVAFDRSATVTVKAIFMSHLLPHIAAACGDGTGASTILAYRLLPPSTVCECMARALWIEVGAE